MRDLHSFRHHNQDRDYTNIEPVLYEHQLWKAGTWKSQSFDDLESAMGTGKRKRVNNRDGDVKKFHPVYFRFRVRPGKHDAHIVYPNKKRQP
jgi:hypothetical protein